MQCSWKLWLVALVVSLCGASSGSAAQGADASAATAHSELINDALKAVLDHQARWAYTETRIGMDREGNPTQPSIHRFDPSKPYAEQYTPILVRGKPPTEKQRKEAAERGQRIAQRRLDAQAKSLGLAAAPERASSRVDEVNLRVRGRKVVPQIDRAQVVAEDDATVTYSVPLLPPGEKDRMLEKFELTARINKSSRQFETVTIRQQAPMRVKLIAKVSAMLLQIDFSTPDPRYPAFATKMTARGSVALLFGQRRDFAVESVRTELQHVTPYDERFQVQIGEARTIEF